MQKRSGKYRKYSQLAFLIWLLIGVVSLTAFLLLISLTPLSLYTTFSQLRMQLSQNCFNILSSPYTKDIATHTILTFVSSFILYRFVYSITNSIMNFYKTRRYVQNLQIIRKHKSALIFEYNSPEAFSYNGQIYLASWLIKNLHKDEIDVIILHEEAHMRSSDNLKLHFVAFICNFISFIPGLKNSRYDFEQLLESASDEYALNRSRKLEPLLSAMQKVLSFGEANSSILLLKFIKFESISRVDNLIENSSSAVTLHIAKLFGILMLLLFALASAQPFYIEAYEGGYKRFEENVQSVGYRCTPLDQKNLSEKMFFSPAQ